MSKPLKYSLMAVILALAAAAVLFFCMHGRYRVNVHYVPSVYSRESGERTRSFLVRTGSVFSVGGEDFTVTGVDQTHMEITSRSMLRPVFSEGVPEPGSTDFTLERGAPLPLMDEKGPGPTRSFVITYAGRWYEN